VGLSVLSGAHGVLVPRVVQALRDRGLDDVLVVVGGIIPDRDVPALIEAGAAAVFPPASRIEDIVSFIRNHAPER